MPVVFKNPDLPDYFVEHADTSPLLQPYEDAKVITLPALKPNIDHDFWAGLPADNYPGLKKASSNASGALLQTLINTGVPSDLAESIEAQAQDVLSQVLPTYEKLFDGYAFIRKKIVWRLTTTMAENLHVDAYKEPARNHFARLFINLDNQPRIWQTSWTLAELYERFGREVLRIRPDASPDLLHAGLNSAAFGKTSKDCFDSQPRHIIYFQPGDCWTVESRQVAHQIFYGRRAVSIDFQVDPASMLHPERQYLAVAEAFAADRAPA